MLSMLIIFALFAVIPAVSYSSERWAARYHGPEDGQDEASAIAVDADGNVYVTGNSYGTYETKLDYATIKYSEDIHGCIDLDYSPLINKKVILKQNGEINGCAY